MSDPAHETLGRVPVEFWPVGSSGVVLVDAIGALVGRATVWAGQVVTFDTGQPTGRHPAPYRPALSWDENATLRRVASSV